MVNFAATREDAELIDNIVERAWSLGIKRGKAELLMDLRAANNSCPLKLKEMYEAPEFDFIHDVVGIINHLNRTTGELEDCFCPRFAKPEK